jgi:hypothetical protein
LDSILLECLASNGLPKARIGGRASQRGSRAPREAAGISKVDHDSDTVYNTTVRVTQIVMDTSVLIAALHSQLGAAYRLLSLVGTSKFDINLSVPLVLEYEDVAKRMSDEIGLSLRAIDDIIDYLVRSLSATRSTICGGQYCLIQRMIWYWRSQSRGNATLS